MKTSKKESKRKKSLSMKEAFEAVKKVEVKRKDSKRRRGIRRFWWNYPELSTKFIKATRPLSYILLFSLIGISLFFFLKDSNLIDRIKKEEDNSFVEGSVGAISSLNPIFLTQNPIDKAIHELVFERFIDIDKDGKPLPGIAKEWKVSNDSLSYSFTIEEGHYWQDGEPLTMDDVYFTFDTAIKLAEKYNTDSVGVPLVGVGVEVVDSDTIKFVLENTNALFFEAVSVYILPKQRLESVSLSNLKFDIFTKYPLGSGPFKVVKSEPNIVVMEASDYYPKDLPIDNFTYRVYEDLDSLEVAFRNGELDAASGVDSGGMDFVGEYSSFKVLSKSIDYRTRMIFFNNRRESLAREEVRQALNFLTDKERLLEDTEIPADIAMFSLPSSSWAFNSDAQDYSYDPEKAEELLEELDYNKNENSGYYEEEDNKILSFTLSYLDNSLNERIVTSLEKLWKEEGVILNLEPLSYDQITQEIISTRNFEMILYEVETTIDPDQYNLWHSLKKDYPDLNLSGYDYERVDILLEEARIELDKDVRKEKYLQFHKYIMDDAPAIFLYHPKYVYIIPQSLQGVDLEEIAYPEDRFKNISDWKL